MIKMAIFIIILIVWILINHSCVRRQYMLLFLLYTHNGMQTIKVINASQARSINIYKNTTTKLMRCCANTAIFIIILIVWILINHSCVRRQYILLFLVQAAPNILTNGLRMVKRHDRKWKYEKVGTLRYHQFDQNNIRTMAHEEKMS
jgi:hypothetical protein